MSFVYPEDHLHAIAERDAAVDAAMKAANELHEITRDRDEWRRQHENLLAMYRAQTEELANLRNEPVCPVHGRGPSAQCCWRVTPPQTEKSP